MGRDIWFINLKEWNVNSIEKNKQAYRFGLLAIALVLGFGGLTSTGAFQTGQSRRSLSSVKPGALPAGNQAITHDAALYERIKQLDLERAPTPSFDDELARLSSQESRHREKLPGLAGHPRLSSAVKRLSAGPYRVRR